MIDIKILIRKHKLSKISKKIIFTDEECSLIKFMINDFSNLVPIELNGEIIYYNKSNQRIIKIGYNDFDLNEIIINYHLEWRFLIEKLNEHKKVQELMKYFLNLLIFKGKYKIKNIHQIGYSMNI